MTTPTKRLQIKIPFELSAAIRRVALSHRRTEHLEILDILLTAPSLQVALKEEAARLSEEAIEVCCETPVVKRSVLDVLSPPAGVLSSPAGVLSPSEAPAWSVVEAAPEDIYSKPEDLASLSPKRYCHSWEVRARSFGARRGMDIRPGYDNSPGMTRYQPCPPEGLDWYTVYENGVPTSESGTEESFGR